MNYVRTYSFIDRSNFNFDPNEFGATTFLKCAQLGNSIDLSCEHYFNGTKENAAVAEIEISEPQELAVPAGGLETE